MYETLEDHVGIRQGDKVTHGICGHCQKPTELKAEDFPQNVNGCFIDGGLYKFKCSGCFKPIVLYTELQLSHAELELKLIEDAIEKASKILGVCSENLKTFVDKERVGNAA